MINRLPLYKVANNSAFLGTAQTKSQQNRINDEYNDPLTKWPVRGLAYTNELGAALREIAPTMGTLLWFPAMLYFGADIYDKYKNAHNSYDPNAKRGFEQALFQLLASVILPTGAVIAGQKIASKLGAFDKSGLTLQTREEIVAFLQRFVNRRHIDKFKDNKEAFKSHFEESICTNRDKLVRNNKSKNIFQWLHTVIIKKAHPEVLGLSQKDKVLQYADKKIDQMFRIYEDLANNEQPIGFSDKLWDKFNKLKETYFNDPDYKSTYVRDAAEDVIFKFQRGQIQKIKLLKTLGGFVALGLAIKPVDNFVENIVIKRGVDPIIKYAEKRNSDKKV